MTSIQFQALRAQISATYAKTKSALNPSKKVFMYFMVFMTLMIVGMVCFGQTQDSIQSPDPVTIIDELKAGLPDEFKFKVGTIVHRHYTDDCEIHYDDVQEVAIIYHAIKHFQTSDTCQARKTYHCLVIRDPYTMEERKMLIIEPSYIIYPKMIREDK